MIQIMELKRQNFITCGQYDYLTYQKKKKREREKQWNDIQTSKRVQLSDKTTKLKNNLFSTLTITNKKM